MFFFCTCRWITIRGDSGAGNRSIRLWSFTGTCETVTTGPVPKRSAPSALEGGPSRRQHGSFRKKGAPGVVVPKCNTCLERSGLIRIFFSNVFSRWAEKNDQETRRQHFDYRARTGPCQKNLIVFNEFYTRQAGRPDRRSSGRLPGPVGLPSFSPVPVYRNRYGRCSHGMLFLNS